jgi:hypothetical protein
MYSDATNDAINNADANDTTTDAVNYNATNVNDDCYDANNDTANDAFNEDYANSSVNGHQG